MVKGLCEICNPKQWKTIPANLLTKTGYPVYGANGIIGYYTNYNHEQPTILITCRGATCGTLNICAPFSYVNGNAMALDNLSEEINIQYLYYYLLSRGLSDVITGSAQPQIVKQSLEKVKVTYPTLAEQRKIAAVLDKVSGLIAKRRTQLDKLEDLVKSRFIEMFGDFKINTMRWPVVGFNEIAIIDGNMTTDYKKYANCPHIGIDSIEKETGRLSGYRTVAEDGVISGKYVFTSKHVIYSKIRPNLNKVALPEFDGLCSADAYPILPMDGKCNRIFLAYNMRSQFFLDYILQFCNRTNLPKVNRKEVAGFQTPLPPIELQNQFAAFVDQTEKTKTAISHSLEKLKTLKKVLMQSFFSKE